MSEPWTVQQLFLVDYGLIVSMDRLCMVSKTQDSVELSLCLGKTVKLSRVMNENMNRFFNHIKLLSVEYGWFALDDCTCIQVKLISALTMSGDCCCIYFDSVLQEDGCLKVIGPKALELYAAIYRLSDPSTTR